MVLVQFLILAVCVVTSLVASPLLVPNGKVNTQKASLCLNKCIENQLKTNEDIDFRADLKWYELVDEYALQLIENNGSLTETGEYLTSEICSSIIPHAIPAWTECSQECAVFDPLYTEAARSYAESYLVQSCAEPEKFVKAQICLHQIIDEIDTSHHFVKKMQDVISNKIGFKKIDSYTSTEYHNEVLKIAKQAVVGPDGMLCHRFIRVMDRFEDLELCGWKRDSLTAMLNNKLSRAAILNEFAFTRIEDCVYE